jgi:hypothetical protein
MFKSKTATLISALAIIGSFSNAYAVNKRIQWNVNQHFYQRFDQYVTWDTAKSSCEALGAHLITITSAAEDGFIQNSQLFSVNWIGASDADVETKIQWVTGEPWVYKYYSRSNSKSADYVYSQGNGSRWATATHTDTMPYICEWSANNHIGMTTVPDLNGNGSSEIAALYVDYVTTEHTVDIRDPKTDTTDTLTFSKGLRAPQGVVTVADINGNGVPEIGVLYLENNQPTVGIKDALDNSSLLKTLPFLNNAFNPKEITVLPDTNGNGSSEIAVLGLNKNTNAAKVEIRDSSTGELLDDTRF